MLLKEANANTTKALMQTQGRLGALTSRHKQVIRKAEPVSRRGMVRSSPAPRPKCVLPRSQGKVL